MPYPSCVEIKRRESSLFIIILVNNIIIEIDHLNSIGLLLKHEMSKQQESRNTMLAICSGQFGNIMHFSLYIRKVKKYTQKHYHHGSRLQSVA